MLSYKKWKKINESFGVNLGVKSQNKINNLHSKWDEMGMSMPLMKKSKKSHHDEDEDHDDHDMDDMDVDNLGGEEEEDAPPVFMKKKSKKMFAGDGPDMGSSPDLGGDGPPMKKKGKKPPFGGGDDLGGDDLGDEEGDLGGDDLGDEEGDDLGGDDLGDEEGDDLGGDDLGDEEGDDLGGDDLGDEGPTPGMGGPDDAPPPKKKGGGFIGKTKDVADGAKMMHKGATKMMKGMKGESAKNCGSCMDKDDDMEIDSQNGKMFSKKSKKSRKMTKEEVEFFRSLQSQTGSCKFAKDESGAWTPVTEDSIIPPCDPNANIVDDDEPGPGEVGHAPQGRVGSIGSFTEWAEKYKRKSKINESTRR